MHPKRTIRSIKRLLEFVACYCAGVTLSAIYIGITTQTLYVFKTGLWVGIVLFVFGLVKIAYKGEREND